MWALLVQEGETRFSYQLGIHNKVPDFWSRNAVCFSEDISVLKMSEICVKIICNNSKVSKCLENRPIWSTAELTDARRKHKKLATSSPIYCM